VPNPAPDRVRSAPFAALLLLLGVLLGSGGAGAADLGLRGASRPGAVRHGATLSLSRSAPRAAATDDYPEPQPNASGPPSLPSVVTVRLTARPANRAASAASLAPAGQAFPSYRARAPPAA
jgi:hypothetical protein